MVSTQFGHNETVSGGTNRTWQDSCDGVRDGTGIQSPWSGVYSCQEMILQLYEKLWIYSTRNTKYRCFCENLIYLGGEISKLNCLWLVNCIFIFCKNKGPNAASQTASGADLN